MIGWYDEFADFMLGLPLTAAEVHALPEGTKITVTWAGGNGPHEYEVTVDGYERRYAWVPKHDLLRFYNPLEFVGVEKYHTRVWRTE